MFQANKFDSKDNSLTNTSEIVHRHLQDVNHKITEEEIRNIKIGATFEMNDHKSNTLEKA